MVTHLLLPIQLLVTSLNLKPLTSVNPPPVAEATQADAGDGDGGDGDGGDGDGNDGDGNDGDGDDGGRWRRRWRRQ